jgi:hypothetical protein
VANHSFEVFIQRAKPEAIDWQNFITSVFQFDRDFSLEIDFGTEVSFHLSSRRDLSPLATKILPFVLRAEKPSGNPAPDGQQKSKSIFFVRLPAKMSILEIKEREGIKKGRALKKVVWHMTNYYAFKTSMIEMHFEDNAGNTLIAKRTFPDIPFHLLQGIDWSSAVKYKKKDIPVYLKLEKTSSIFNEDKMLSFLEVEGFPYLTGDHYFGLKNFEFNKHTLVVGQTGVGKSKFLGLFVNEIAKMGLDKEYAVVVIDPHASLYTDINNVPNPLNVDFRGNACDLFFQNSEPKIGAELTITLLRTLLPDQFNAKMEQVLKYTIFSLLSTGKMSLFNLKKFLTDNMYRTEVLKEMPSSENMMHFFDTEFIEISGKYYDTAIMPVLTLVDELNFLPVFSGNNSIAVEDALNNNFLTCFSLSKIFLGDRATKLIAGLLIQQIFLLAQSKRLNKKIILLIDEVPVVQNDALITILSEARKFNLSLLLSMQYLTQVTPELLKGVLTNTYNYFVFRSTEEDAKLMEKNLFIEIPEEVVKSWEQVGESKEGLRIKLITNLNVRECIARVYASGQFYNAFKARTVDFT